MIRLSQICLLVFLATLGFYLYQLHEQSDYSLAFLMMGATGCLYLLLRTEQRYTRLTRYRAMSTPTRDNRPKRIAPECLGGTQFTERRTMPTLVRASEQKTTATADLPNR